ncbi:integrase [Bacillus cereus]|nr:integrase [Bacillus cereus]
MPEPVRPKYHSNDPLFIVFDFTRGTYHWSYDDAPKFLTEISIQKMIRLEVKCANLRKGISAQHFRNTFILRKIQGNTTSEQIM